MEIIEIFVLGIGLAMDAFAVSICKGLSMQKMSIRKAIVIAIYFGIFQAIMPVIGYFLGNSLGIWIIKYNHWIALVLLGAIGINMIKDALCNEGCNIDENIDFKTMTGLAIATSIDALAVGVTFAALEVNLILSICIIGVITFIMCFVGVKIGNIFGDRYQKKAEIVGGLILIFLGIKILLEHLYII